MNENYFACVLMIIMGNDHLMVIDSVLYVSKGVLLVGFRRCFFFKKNVQDLVRIFFKTKT